MKHKLPKLRSKKSLPRDADATERITTETMAAHREQILGSARKYIYPLTHSKHRLVVVSLTLFFVSAVIFFSYCVVALYKFRSQSTFLYRVTQVVPFPIARIGSDFVAYENYLFEVNRYTYYYRNQQKLDFNAPAGKQQLAAYEKQAFDKVVNDAYIKRLAREKGVSVSDREVDDEIAIIRSQNKLGSSDKELEAVLKDFWNWSVQDFRRSLHQQLLTQKLTSTLDTKARAQASAAHAQLKQGKSFAEVAKAVSEDPPAKQTGGGYSFQIEKTNRDLPPKIIDVLFRLKPGEYSQVLDVGYGLEIVKNIEQKDGRIRAAHILFNFQDITTQLNDIKDQQKTHSYIRF